MNPEKHGVNLGLQMSLESVMFDKDHAQLLFKSSCTNRYGKVFRLNIVLAITRL